MNQSTPKPDIEATVADVETIAAVVNLGGDAEQRKAAVVYLGGHLDGGE